MKPEPQRGSMEADVVGRLQSLPTEGTRKYEMEIQSLVTSLAGSPNFAKALDSLVRDQTLPENVRYAAFFGLTTLYRRLKKTTAAGKLFSEFGNEFSKHVTYHHILGIHYAEEPTETSLKQAIVELKQAYTLLPENSGILNAYARVVATAIERGYDFLTAEDKTAAWDLINKAIMIDSYPKYYSIKGRLAAALFGNFDEARTLIREAIDLENSTQQDYAIRIGEYQANLLEVDIMQQSKRLAESTRQVENSVKASEAMIKEHSRAIEEQTKRTESSLAAIQASQILTLGFFAALLTFILASVQVLSHMTFGQAMVLTPTLGLTVLFVLYGFTSLIHVSMKQMTIPFVVSAGVLAAIIVLLYILFQA